MFDGFQLDRVDVGEVTLRVRYGGEGEPVVLLHGHPRTHTTWHRVAPQLAGSFFVVCPDLRGYGQSTLPPDAPGHAQSSKRAMAGDVVALMRYLGHDRFSVVGHDRGALVAFRTAMDHPDDVEWLVVMDGLPVIEHLERLNEAFVRTWWHWWFLGQTDKPTEAVHQRRSPPLIPDPVTGRDGGGQPRRRVGRLPRPGRRPRHVRGTTASA